VQVGSLEVVLVELAAVPAAAIVESVWQDLQLPEAVLGWELVIATVAEAAVGQQVDEVGPLPKVVEVAQFEVLHWTAEEEQFETVHLMVEVEQLGPQHWAVEEEEAALPH